MQKNDQHGPAENIAHREITAIRNILSMPTRQDAAWSRLTKTERSILCKAAEIQENNSAKEWESIAIEHRTRIKDAARRASEWAKALDIL